MICEDSRRNMMLKFFQRASFTIEASIVFSVVFLVIIVLVYIFIIFYQYVYLQSIANQAAIEGSKYYVNQYAVSDDVHNITDLYWRIADTRANEKKFMLNSYIKSKLSNSITNSAKYTDNKLSAKFLIQQANVTIREHYIIPFGEIFNIFGLGEMMSINAEATYPINDNAEFVRNLDIVIDIKSCLLNSDNKWIGKDSELSAILDNLLKAH